MEFKTESYVMDSARKEFISEILKTMVTPNLKSSNHSQDDENSYKEIISAAKSGKKISKTIPFDFLTRNELFNLIKDEKVFVTQSVKFIATVSTIKPIESNNSLTYYSKYSDYPFSYTFLDNHPGIINIDKLKDIPIDYEGLMSVPATILEYKNFKMFNIHRVIYTPVYNGKKLYQRIVISNKVAVTE